MRGKQFTDEDRQWLKDNYPHLSNKQCMVHFGCGSERLKTLVEECGLEYKLQVLTPKKKKKPIWIDNDNCTSFCLDCKDYIKTGICGKTGKDVGALWKKKCFNQ